MDLILASTSPYRERLLQRLALPFRTARPNTDETPYPKEAPDRLAGRLALAKATSIASQNPAAWVIGSDQTAELEGQLLNKPGDHQNATRQLRACAGKSLKFHTGLALVNLNTGYENVVVVPFSVRFRPLSHAQIEGYLRAEQPYDCAGSFKWEALGIALFESLEGTDPTSLEGLPLIALTHLLFDIGIDILLYNN